MHSVDFSSLFIKCNDEYFFESAFPRSPGLEFIEINFILRENAELYACLNYGNQYLKNKIKTLIACSFKSSNENGIYYRKRVKFTIILLYQQSYYYYFFVLQFYIHIL